MTGFLTLNSIMLQAVKENLNFEYQLEKGSALETYVF